MTILKLYWQNHSARNVVSSILYNNVLITPFVLQIDCTNVQQLAMISVQNRNCCLIKCVDIILCVYDTHNGSSIGFVP